MPDGAAPRHDAVRRVALADDTDLDGFRRQARRLLAEGVPPQSVEWRVEGAAAGELFDADAVQPIEAGAAPDAGAGAQAAGPAVPAAFIDLCAEVALHRDPGRFGLLYRLLWRLVHEPALRGDPIDADRMAADRMARAVRREVHKMHAFVRFRPIAVPGTQGDGTLHVAWFEPEHHIVETAAPFFARRFATLRWAILTPEKSVRWDGTRLDFGPGACREDAPGPDAGEALWLTYYEHIFNPARLKLAAMQREMPRRYWANLPEASLIVPLAAQAHERAARMVERPAAGPRRRIALRGETQPPAPGIDTAIALPDVDSDTPAAERSALLAARREAASHCRECPLHRDATQTVFGEGPVSPPLMLVGEQPGDREDLRGRPFVGPAGQLLDRALEQLGWLRERLYVTNAVKHFKFELRGKRRIHETPVQREADACAHWLESEIALVRPHALIALGATAARQLLGRPVAVLRERGRWHERADGQRVLVTLHPSALLRTPPALRDEAVAGWLNDLRLASPLVEAAAAAATGVHGVETGFR